MKTTNTPILNEARCIQEKAVEKTPHGHLPLCVNLDEALLPTDLYLEALLLLLKQEPWVLLLLPFWAIKGKAHIRHQVARKVSIDVASLPYREDVLNYLKSQYASGRKLVLITESGRDIAMRINDHLQIFSEIIACEGKTGRAGSEKSRILESRFGYRGFDYLGNSSTDLKVWSVSNGALVAEPSPKILGQVAQKTPIQETFPLGKSAWTSLIKEIRVYQWIKNILIFLPIATAHSLFNTTALAQACLGFLAFSLCASSLYIFNDLLDLPADRRHPKKKFRPFASGALSLQTGFFLQPLLFFTAFLISFHLLPSGFSYLLLTYALTTTVYSVYLKKTAILDVLTLAGLYTLRILAGGIAVGITISSWLLAFSLFFFLSLAMGKRYAELQFRKVSTFQGIERRAYVGGDKEILGTMGIVSGYLSVLVLALYLNSQEVSTLYDHPQLLWLICPLLLYWVSRTWLLANRGSLDDDPLIVALKDPKSYIVAFFSAVITLIAI